MIAARCVPIALGGDIAGSLRWPTVFCGIYGFKPTFKRVSMIGMSPPRVKRITHFTHMLPSPGPMGSSVDDLILGMNILSPKDAHLYDTETVPLGWRWEQTV